MTSAPARLRSAIARDLRPTRPLRPPLTRALALAPLALATVAAVPLLHFFRSDLPQLGYARAWGLSVAEAGGGLAIVALALRESIPGRALSRRALAATFAAGLVLPFVLVGLTAESFSIGAPPGAEWTDGIICFRTSALAAVPALLASTLLVARAFPLRPGVAGALYGLGCGLVADAGLRLFCEFTVPSHVVAAHGGAVMTAMLAGFLLAKSGIRHRP